MKLSHFHSRKCVWYVVSEMATILSQPQCDKMMETNALTYCRGWCGLLNWFPPFVSFFFFFFFYKTPVTFHIPSSYLASVTAAKLLWHLPNTNVIQRICIQQIILQIQIQKAPPCLLEIDCSIVPTCAAWGCCQAWTVETVYIGEGSL